MTCTQLALALDLASPPTAAATTPAAATARTGCWVAVASAAHVRRGRAEGFMQVCHGKAAPLRRVWPGDRVVYYSPTITMGGNDSLRAFTALGRVRQGSAYPHDMGGGFVPWRRDVDWQAGAQDAPIAPLLPLMDWTRGQKNWAYPLRFGLFAIGVADMDCIAQAMGERVA